MVGARAGGTNTLHVVAMSALVVLTAFVVGYVVFDLEATVVPTETQPEASFQFGYDESTDELAVTHYGGDNLDAGRVVVLDGAFDEVGRWPASEPVSAGDTVTVSGVSRDDTIYVMWETPDGTYLTLATWNPDASTAPTTAATATTTAVTAV